MVYFGKVKNGTVIPEPGARLTEGDTVRIEPVDPARDIAPDPDAVYRIGELAVDDGGPPDMAAEHDHYIHGTRQGRPFLCAGRMSA